MGRTAITILILATVLCAQVLAAEPTHCTGCIDGQPTATCPKPQQCGYKPILCVNCMNGMAMPQCPNISWCGGVDCDSASCVNGAPTASCPDPGTCGFTPIPCSGCIANASTTSCPDPSLCYQGLSTPPCMNCMTGMAMPYCPDPNVCVVEPEPTPEVVHCTGCIDSTWTESQYTQNTSCPKPQLCGYKPVLCVDCMDGMAMPLCVNASWCAGVDCSNAATDCVAGEPTAKCPDPGTCALTPIPCVGCVPGLYRAACPHPEYCFQNMTTPPCMGCMEGMAMPYCPNATACMGTGPDPDPTPSPLQCDGCMAGMAMPGCPYPDLCPSDSCMMQMYFGVSGSTCLFLESWHVSNSGQWAGAFFAILLLAALREGLAVWRVHQHLVTKQEDTLRRLFKDRTAGTGRVGDDIQNDAAGVQLRQKPLLGDAKAEAAAQNPKLAKYNVPPPTHELIVHFVDSFYYLVSLVLGYLLMLIIMTYNIWLCLMTVLNCFLMHFVWNYLYHTYWRRSYVHRVRCVVQEWKDTHASLQSSVRDATGVVLEGPSKPTGGDHCCDDLGFDDI